ncbi:MAG: N-acetylmuramoyl-L-alanine amidase [Flavobacteriaceae bacterium]|nr:N-acetylmuramoyl-L-alanine amidase [Flavobacteriaceae bacterium]
MRTKQIQLFILAILVSLSFAFNSHNNDTEKPFVVVLDAGHGGHDGGKHYNGYKESDIALKITLKVGAELEKDPNFKVIYTRKKDVFVKLKERGAIANRADADLFVSIHCNAHNSQAYGAETFVLGLHANERNLEVAKKENEVIFLEENFEENYAGYDPNSPESFIGLTLMQEEYLDQSIMLASLVQNNFVNRLKRKDRSVKQAGFIVLHQSYMPSVLIETGFLTNRKEGAYLNSKKGQNEMAKSIADAIKSYKKNISLATSDSQNPIITQEEIDEAIAATEERIYEGITFKVQLAASSKKLDTKPYNFKGLDEITRNKEDGLFKYYYGETSDYNKIQLMKKFAREKGYPSSYVVAFREGNKVRLSEILKQEDR